MLLHCCYNNGMNAWQWARAVSTNSETANTKFTDEPLQIVGTACALDSIPINLEFWFGLLSMKRRWRVYSWPILTCITDENPMKKCAQGVKFNPGQKASVARSPLLLHGCFPMLPQTWPPWWKAVCCLEEVRIPSLNIHIKQCYIWDLKKRNEQEIGKTKSTESTPIITESESYKEASGESILTRKGAKSLGIKHFRPKCQQNLQTLYLPGDNALL